MWFPMIDEFYKRLIDDIFSICTCFILNLQRYPEAAMRQAIVTT